MYNEMTAGMLSVAALSFQTILLIGFADKLSVENEEQVRADLAVISFLIKTALTAHLVLNVV